MQQLINVATLPEATTFLNYPSAGPAIGSYFGPNDLGEYLTVVSNESWAYSTLNDRKADPRCRVGLRHGVYTIDGEQAGPTPIPPEVLLFTWTKAQQIDTAAWQPVKTPPILGLVSRG